VRLPCIVTFAFVKHILVECTDFDNICNKPQFTSVRDGNLFASSIISHWNSLSNSFVSSPSVASFKCKLGSLNFHL